MKLPVLKHYIPKTKKQTIEFRGINVTGTAAIGDFVNMNNLCSEEYPCLKTRRQMKKVDIYKRFGFSEQQKNGRITDIFFNGEIAVITEKLDDTGDELLQISTTSKNFILDSRHNKDGNNSQGGTEVFENNAAGYERSVMWMNGNLLVYPDRLYFDENWENACNGPVVTLPPPYSQQLAMTRYGPDTITVVFKNKIYIYGHQNIINWLLGKFNNGQKIRLFESGNNEINKITTITGNPYQQTGEAEDIKELSHFELYADKLRLVIPLAEDSYEIKGNSGYYIPKNSVTITSDAFSKNSDMFILNAIEYNNRIWGTEGNTIRASALGKHDEWDVFEGVSTDSYAVDVASGGEFTGMIMFGGAVHAFKEDCVYKIYGYKPSNYELIPMSVSGLPKGAAKSLVIVKDILFYKSHDCVMAYSGSQPQDISKCLGDLSGHAVCAAGTDGNKYYLSLSKDGIKKTYVFDTKTKLWHIEEGVDVIAFKSAGAHRGMYAVKNSEVFQYCDDAALNIKNPVRWEAEMSPIHEFISEKKIYSKFILKVELAKESKLNIYMNCDKKGYKKIKMAASAGGTVSIPVIPSRCDELNLKFTGEGPCKLISLTRIYREGSYK